MIALAVLVAVLFLRLGVLVPGVNDMSGDSIVRVYRTTTTWDIDQNVFVGFKVTDTLYELNTEQIEMIRQFVHNLVFIRRPWNTATRVDMQPGELDIYLIWIEDKYTNGINTTSIELRWGYFTAWGSQGHFPARGDAIIINVGWERRLRQILELTDEAQIEVSR